MIGRLHRSIHPSRSLRALVGAREDILAATPSERLAYTSLGAVVLTAAGFAALSIGTALYFAFGRFSPWIIPIALAWGLFILSLDRWFASAPPVSRTRTLPRIASRLALAVLLGVILAEPLMLGIFQTAVDEQVARTRQQTILEFESQLRTCNQLSPSATLPADQPDHCADKRLSSYAPALIRAEQLAGLRQEAEALQAEITKISATSKQLQEAAYQECSGTSGNGLNGKAGVGPQCRHLRALADRYLADSGLDAKQDRLRAVNASISDLGRDSDEYLLMAAVELEHDIEAEVRQARASQKRVGLLERMAALNELTRENSYLAVAQSTLWLTLVLIEIMPALLRILMGATNHDRLVRISERERINAYVVDHAYTTQDLFQALETRRQELSSELPRPGPEVLR